MSLLLGAFRIWKEGDAGPVQDLCSRASDLDLDESEKLLLQALEAAFISDPAISPEAAAALLCENDLDDIASELETILRVCGESKPDFEKAAHLAVDEELAEENKPQPPEQAGGFPSAILECLPEPVVRGDLEPALRQFRKAVDLLDPVRRELERQEAIAVLGRKGVASPARLIDVALSGLNGVSPSVHEGQGRVFEFKDPEPWPDPVDGAELLEVLREVLNRFLILPLHAAVAVSLWIVGTWVFAASENFPILHVTSPEKRCGKSRLLDVIAFLVHRPLRSCNITGACLFRIIEMFQPTLEVDEIDSFATQSDELRGLLNSCFSRSGATVTRLVGDDHEPRSFSTYTPVALGGIGNLPGTVADRAIPIAMRRKLPTEKTARLRRREIEPMAAPIQSKCARWAKDNLESLSAARPELPEALDDRARDAWEILVAIADAARGEWPQRAREAAVALSTGGDDEGETLGVQLLGDLQRLFEKREVDRLLTEEILRNLNALDDRPWPTVRRGKPLDARKLARLLGPYGVKPRTLREGEIRAKGYLREHLEEAWAHYLPRRPVPQPIGTPPSDPCQRDNAVNTGTFDDFRSVTGLPMSRIENGENPYGNRGCHGVTDRTGGDRVAQEGEGSPSLPIAPGPQGSDGAGPEDPPPLDGPPEGFIPHDDESFPTSTEPPVPPEPPMEEFLL